jgi:hypothetical protein
MVGEGTDLAHCLLEGVLDLEAQAVETNDIDGVKGSEGQQSIVALDLVFGALENAGVDARQRKIVWADGKRLSIEQSTDRIHAGHPGVRGHLIETHVLGWLENCAPESYSERQLEELDRLIGPWLDDYERTSRAARE